MPKYTLIYFDVRARAEISRLIFAAAGQEYEDKRVREFTEPDLAKVMQLPQEERQFHEEWLQLKPKVPFGQLPALEVDGQTIIQSKVIATFLARRLGLAGKTDLDDARAAMIAESCEEIFMNAIFKLFSEKDEEKKAAEIKKYVTETLTENLGRLEKLVGEKGYFVADQLSYADIAFYFNNSWTSYIKHEIDWAKYPKLKAVQNNVANNPGIAKWVRERPQTMF